MAPHNRKLRARWHRWLIRIGWAVVLALILAYMPYRFMGDNPSKKGVPELRTDLARTQTQLEALARENARLRLDIHALRNDPEAIRDIARDELGYVRPTDLVIRVKGIEWIE